MPEDKPVEPNADIWPDMLSIADASEKALALAFLQAIKKYKNSINKDDLIYQLKTKDINEVIKVFPEFKIPGFNKVGKKIIDDISKKLFDTYNFSVIGLDIKELELHNFIDKYVANLVVQIEDNTKLAIKDMIRDGWDKQINPETLAKQIKESGIGLDTNREKSLINYRNSLYKDEDLRKRFPDFNSFEKEISRRCMKKYESLLLDRGRTIARTEAMNFVNEGSRQMYEEAAKNNSILKEQYELCWILTPDDRLCYLCRAMKNERCSFDGTFKGGLRRPTLHPRCRCCLVCVRKNSKALQSLPDIPKKPEKTPKQPRDTKPEKVPTKPKVPKEPKTDKLTEDEKYSVENYVSDGFLDTNKYLRGQKYTGRSENIDKNVKRIDSAINKSSVNKCTVYRGFENDDIYKNLGSLENTVIQDKAFVSTSLNRNIADFYSTGNKNMVMEIVIPDKSKALKVGELATNKKEEEILLPRNSKFKILESSKSATGRGYIKAELIQ